MIVHVEHHQEIYGQDHHGSNIVENYLAMQVSEVRNQGVHTKSYEEAEDADEAHEREDNVGDELVVALLGYVTISCNDINNSIIDNLKLVRFIIQI